MLESIVKSWLHNTNFHVQFYSPHWPRISLHSEGFSLPVALTPRRLQCYLKIMYTKVYIAGVS